LSFEIFDEEFVAITTLSVREEESIRTANTLCLIRTGVYAFIFTTEITIFARVDFFAIKLVDQLVPLCTRTSVLGGSVGVGTNTTCRIAHIVSSDALVFIDASHE